jgi:apolipoprotein N-acyltransferase
MVGESTRARTYHRDTIRSAASAGAALVCDSGDRQDKCDQDEEGYSKVEPKLESCSVFNFEIDHLAVAVEVDVRCLCAFRRLLLTGPVYK